MTLALDTFQVQPTSTLTEPLTLRLWYNNDFLDVNDIPILAGPKNFYIEFGCSLASGVITVTTEDIFTTLDANVQNPQSINCSAQFFVGNSGKEYLFTQWVIPSEAEYPGGTILFSQLAIYNNGSNTLANPPSTYLTTAQTVAYFATLDGGGSDASALVKGIAKLSVAPVSAVDPIALGQNDTSVVTLTGSQSLSNKTLASATIATTQSAGDSSTKIATTAFATTADNLKANLASPTFTGTPTLPIGSIGVTQSALDSSTKLATTAFVTTADNLKANLASPTFTGTPTLPTGSIATTQSAGNSTTALATTAFVTTADNLKADKASPTFTGTVVIPTPFTLGAVSVTATGTELNFVDGVTSAIQTQMDTKAPLASPTLVTPVLGVATATSVAASSFLKVNATGKLATAPKTNDTWGAAISLDVTISSHDITGVFGTSSTATITPTAAGTAGDWIFINTINGAGGTVVVTFASTFHSSGTQSTQASRYSSIAFRSTGTVWVEQYRTTDLT